MRIEYVDKLKGFAILLVVMGHISEKSMDIHNSPFNYFYSSFHMALFMFLSGLYAMKSFEKWNFSEMFIFIKKKTLRIILPFIVVGGSYSMLCYHDLSVIFPGKEGYWFLPALFYCMLTEMVVGGAVFRLKKSLYIDILFHALFYAILVVAYYGLKPELPYYLSFIKMYPFFLFGVYCTKYPKLFALIKQSKGIMSSSCILYLCSIPLLHLLPVKIAGFFAIVICVQMFIAYDKRIPAWLARIGRSSMAIYVFHWFMLPSHLPIGEVISTIVGPYEELNNGNFILTLCITAAIAIPIAYTCIIVEKIVMNSRWLGLLVFGADNRLNYKNKVC